MKHIKTIAMYLPQFHQIPENDTWWGKGFTEWQAVKMAEPLYVNHRQPRKPLNDRYYNLLDKDTMKWQMKLAKQFLIDGFCFYHYWFENGRRILEKPAENLLSWKEIDMPFCFSWANESWIRTWEKLTEGNAWTEKFDSKINSSSYKNGILMKQDYGDKKEWIEHFEYLLPFFLDKRYMQIEGKPIFIIYKPEHMGTSLTPMLECWEECALNAGLSGLYIIGSQCSVNSDLICPLMDARIKHGPAISLANEERIGRTRIFDYDYTWKRFLGMEGTIWDKTYYCGFVDFDSSPRQGENAIIFKNSDPDKFKQYFEQLVKKSINLGNELVFLNAWNEWGEGMYLEPDEDNGFKYLEAVRDVMQKYGMLEIAKKGIQTQAVDIVVPIYNAYEEVQKCVESIKCHTDLETHRLLLLNDSSSDERIQPYLKDEETDNIIVFSNKKNLGFSANINQGICFSNRDVVLLNSDTIVTDNWLNKLIECAYKEEAIATVTPLSNNANIFSVPEYCRENRLPDGFTIESYAKLVEECSMKRYVTVPTAHGFCMYVKREVIDKIGLMDEVAFERGYGEENDFCYRAGQIGYHDVMCDNTFIYHSGTSSFLSEEKLAYMQRHVDIIKERFGVQFGVTDAYCPSNPNWDIHENVKLQGKLANKERKNILFLLQSDFKEGSADNVGGIQLHVKDLVEELKFKENIVVAARDEETLNITIYIDNETYDYKIPIGKTADFPEIRSMKYYAIYDMILRSFRIQCVHIHHTLGLSLEIFYAARKLRVPIITTLHDYYYLCPNIKMLDYNDKPCLNSENRVRCGKCLKHTHHVFEKTDFLSIWRQENAKALENSQQIIVPSESTKQIIEQYFPNVIGLVSVIEHGSRFDLNGIKTEENRVKEGRKEFRVAFVGGLSVAKGAKYAYEMIVHGSRSIQWYIFGNLGYAPLGQLQQENLIKTGQYKREELTQLINRYEIDLICILPLWEETFCYTLTEALLSQVPVLAIDKGAVGERIKRLECGWVVEPESNYETILDKIEQLRMNEGLYSEVLKRLSNIKIKTTLEMSMEYNDIYIAVSIDKPMFCSDAIRKFYNIQRQKMQLLDRAREEIKPELLVKEQAIESQIVAIENQDKALKEQAKIIRAQNQAVQQQAQTIEILQTGLASYERRIDKFARYFSLLEKWLNKKGHNFKIETYFLEHDYHKIAIYGWGIIGKLLFEELCTDKVTIEYAIDKHKSETNAEIPILPISKNLPEVDVIIITATFDFENIEEELKNYTVIPIISIEEMIFAQEVSDESL